MNSSLRQRIKPSTSADIVRGSYTDSKYGLKNFYEKTLPTSYFFGLLGLMIVVLIASIVVERQLPPGLKISEEHKYPDRFIAERAYNILRNLTALGPRVAGSHTNEVVAVNLLKKEIEDIIANAKKNNVIQMDIQKASGAFHLEFLDGMTNVYRDMQNLIVKIGSEIDSPHSLLLNCHFDTVANSPGASDDGAGCAVMLEMLRVISKSDRILRHNIIFLFNGGEENFLPASHGFITQHIWAKEIRAFINIEACGAGGREILFQAGPNHPWILETYSEEVPYPYASSMAQEIFQSGLIPGDTDYRIFRDFGNLSGLDFAWSANGYVYHTRFDSIDQIPLGTLQRTGDNILALARGMAQGHQLANIEHHKAGNLVFFDFLGAFVVRWPMLIADFINLAAVILSFFCISVHMDEAYKSDLMTPTKYAQKLTKNLVIILVGMSIAVLVAVSIALLLNTLGRTMSWYARPCWLFFLYVIPTTITLMLIVKFHAKFAFKDILSPWTTFKLYYDAYQLFWTIMLLMGIIFRIRSSVICLFWTGFPCLYTLLRSYVFKDVKGGKWLLLYIAVKGLPFVQSVYLMMSALYLCIPIMGRAGAGYNSEVIIAIIVSFLYSLLISFVIPLILIVRSAERVLSLLSGVFMLSLAVLILTPLGFPYSGDPSSPAPQRFMISHAKRTFHDETGKIVQQNSGYWIPDMDINSPHSVDRYVREMKDAIMVDEDCTRYLYCGLPYLVPVQNFIFITHWIEGPEPEASNISSLKVEKRKKIEAGQRISIVARGPPHVGIMLSPALGITLTKWSLVKGTPLAATPLWNGRKTYFIYYCYTGDPKPLEFTIELNIPPTHEGPLLDMAISGHYQFNQSAPEFKKFIDQFPPWTAVTFWSSTFESWIVS